jgi:hypothetical protein
LADRHDDGGILALRFVADLSLQEIAMRIDRVFGAEADESAYQKASGSLAPALLWDEFWIGKPGQPASKRKLSTGEVARMSVARVGPRRDPLSSRAHPRRVPGTSSWRMIPATRASEGLFKTSPLGWPRRDGE